MDRIPHLFNPGTPNQQVKSEKVILEMLAIPYLLKCGEPLGSGNCRRKVYSLRSNYKHHYVKLRGYLACYAAMRLWMYYVRKCISHAQIIILRNRILSFWYTQASVPRIRAFILTASNFHESASLLPRPLTSLLRAPTLRALRTTLTCAVSSASYHLLLL